MIRMTPIILRGVMGIMGMMGIMTRCVPGKNGDSENFVGSAACGGGAWRVDSNQWFDREYAFDLRSYRRCD
jgi:hypothetical protein